MTAKKLRHIAIGILVFAFMHINTSMTSKEDVLHQLPLYLPGLDRFVDNFDELATEMFEKSKAPGAAIAIVKNGNIIYRKGFGVKKYGTTDSIDVHTRFRVGSVSKTFAGVLTGKMVRQGILGWEDKVDQYYPQFDLLNPDFARKMEIQHLLSQTTGLIQHAYTNYIEDGRDLSYMISSLKNVKLTTEPGKIFSYQNVAFGIIEPVLESATGMDYSTLMRKEVFEPLQMKDASMDYVSMMTDENLAYPNFPRRGGWAVGRISKTYYNVPSAGGINASISDMANYMIALTGHRSDIISPEVLSDIFEPRIRTNIHWKYFSRWKDYERSYYGLGWRIVNNGGSTIAYHGGYVNGFRSQLAINTDNDIGICVLTNSPSSYSSMLVPAFLRLFDEYKDELELELNQQSKEGPVI